MKKTSKLILGIIITSALNFVASTTHESLKINEPFTLVKNDFKSVVDWYGDQQKYRSLTKNYDGKLFDLLDVRKEYIQDNNASSWFAGKMRSIHGDYSIQPIIKFSFFPFYNSKQDVNTDAIDKYMVNRNKIITPEIDGYVSEKIPLSDIFKK